MDYEVVQKFRGAKVVTYQCPRCGIDLESPLEEAGTEQMCPTCGGPFVSPGTPELLKEQQERQEQQEQEEREEKERIEAERRAAQERERKDRQRITASPPTPELVWYGKMYCNGCGYTWQARRNTPPARCPSCSKRSVTPVRVPRASGCLTCVLLFVLVAGSFVAGASLSVWR